MRKFLYMIPLFLAAPLAQADTIVQTQTVPDQLTELNNTTANFTKFDSSLGTLLSVSVQYDGHFDSTITLYNHAAQAQTTKATSTVDFSLASSDAGINGLVNSLAISGSATTGSVTLATGETKVYGPYTGSGSDSFASTNSGDLAKFTGPGSFNFTVATLSGLGIVGGGGNIDSSQVTHAGAKVTVTYEYRAVPEPASVVMLGLAGGLLGVAVRFRKRSA